MPLTLTPDDYAGLTSFLRTAAVRAPSNQKARESYARVGLVAGMAGKSMAETQRLIDADDSASLPPAYRELLYARGVQFWDQVIKGANKGLGGKSFGEASEVQPALRGVSGEDMAQIYAVGGEKFPGMKFLENRRADPDADPVPLRAYPDAAKGTKAEKVLGQLVPFDAPVFPVNSNIFMFVGNLSERAGKDPSKHSWFAKKLYSESFQRTRKFVRATKPQKYVAIPERERQMEMLIPGYEGPGDLTAMNLSNPYFINAIDKAVRRRVSGKPTQEWLWGAITMATGKGGKPLLRPVKDKSLPLVLKSTALLKWVEENDYPMPDDIGGRKSLSRSWPKLYKQMLAAYDDLDGSTIERGLGMGTGPARALFRDPAVRDVYLQEISRRRASSRRVAARYRSRSKKAALGPISLGEMMMSAATQARLFYEFDMDSYLDQYEALGKNLVRLGHARGDVDPLGPLTDHLVASKKVAHLQREIKNQLRALRFIDTDRAFKALENMSHAFDLVEKAHR